jgi:hypothetical protein
MVKTNMFMWQHCSGGIDCIIIENSRVEEKRVVRRGGCVDYKIRRE